MKLINEENEEKLNEEEMEIQETLENKIFSVIENLEIEDIALYSEWIENRGLRINLWRRLDDNIKDKLFMMAFLNGDFYQGIMVNPSDNTIINFNSRTFNNALDSFIGQSNNEELGVLLEALELVNNERRNMVRRPSQIVLTRIERLERRIRQRRATQRQQGRQIAVRSDRVREMDGAIGVRV